jgi:hypothetical protein
MKRIIISLTTITIFSLFFFSCYYDNEEALYPSYNTTCDTANVTFTGTIYKMLDKNNCLSCHSNLNAPGNGNIALENYNDVVALNVRIAGSIKHIGTYSFMPKNGGKISACSINQFDIWVRLKMPK